MNTLEQSSPNMIIAKVWRGDKSGNFQSFDVPIEENQTVLDIVTHIQQEIDPTLTYRFSCRVGMCGSCAMMVNGVPRWTCRTHINKVNNKGTIEIAPLRNLPVIKDLATDMSRFFEKWTEANAYFTPTVEADAPIAKIQPDKGPRLEANKAIECINCAVCYAACDVVSANDDYLGPAALNRAWTLHNDERDGATEKRLKAISGNGGCHNCHSHQSCMTYCPNELNPTASIAGLKRAAMKQAIFGK